MDGNASSHYEIVCRRNVYRWVEVGLLVAALLATGSDGASEPAAAFSSAAPMSPSE